MLIFRRSPIVESS